MALMKIGVSNLVRRLILTGKPAKDHPRLGCEDGLATSLNFRKN